MVTIVEVRRNRTPSIDSQSLVRFDTNDYAVPAKHAHRKLIVVSTVKELRVVPEDRRVGQFMSNRTKRRWKSPG